MSAIIQTSPTVSSDAKNIGIAVGMLLLSCIRTEIYIISYLLYRLMAAIFDFSLIPTSDSIRTSPVVLDDLKNRFIAVVSGIQPDICVNFRFMAAILNFGYIV